MKLLQRELFGVGKNLLLAGSIAFTACQPASTTPTCGQTQEWLAFLNECRSKSEVQDARNCEVRTDSKYQYNWYDGKCFPIDTPSPTRVTQVSTPLPVSTSTQRPAQVSTPAPTVAPTPSLDMKIERAIERIFVDPFIQYPNLGSHDAIVRKVNKIPQWLPYDNARKSKPSELLSLFEQYKTDLTKTLDDLKAAKNQVSIFSLGELSPSNTIPAIAAVEENFKQVARYDDTSLLNSRIIDTLIQSLDAYKPIDVSKLPKYHPFDSDPVIKALSLYLDTRRQRTGFRNQIDIYYSGGGRQISISGDVIESDYRRVNRPGPPAYLADVPADTRTILGSIQPTDYSPFFINNYYDAIVLGYDTAEKREWIMNGVFGSRIMVDGKKDCWGLCFDRVFWKQGSTTFYAYSVSGGRYTAIVDIQTKIWDQRSTDNIKKFAGLFARVI